MTGVTSLIVGCHPTFTIAQVRNALQTSADRLADGGSTWPNKFYGHGRVNALKALPAANTMARVGAVARPAAQGADRVSVPIGVRGQPLDGC